VVKDLEFMKGVVKEMGAEHSKQLINTYLPVGDVISFETLENDLETIDSLAYELVKQFTPISVATWIFILIYFS
jgi:hypothetical protein